MIRYPVVAGQFYEASFSALNKQIEDCFFSKLGPGDLPVKRTGNRIRAILAPHAGYLYSGPCAAWAYKEIAESKFPDSFILFGLNHFGADSGISGQEWGTPFGAVSPDIGLISEIAKNTGFKIDESCHAFEHSIEVQLPFLQFACRDRIKELKIVPIAFGRDFEFKKAAKGIADSIKKLGRETVIIISSDFTHYGTNYGFLPFTTDVPEKIAALDKEAIELILGISTTGFKDFINRSGVTICGYMPILVFLAMMEQEENKPKASLLMHYMSGDLTKDYKNSVSYASLLFK